MFLINELHEKHDILWSKLYVISLYSFLENIQMMYGQSYSRALCQSTGLKMQWSNFFPRK